jgi:serine/threonine protein kinase
MSSDSDSDDVPLSQKASALMATAAAPPAAGLPPQAAPSSAEPPPAAAAIKQTATKQNASAAANPVNLPAEPKQAKASAVKRKRGAGDKAPKAAAEPKKSSGVSSRAQRTGAGGWSLNEAAGDLDAEYETLGVLGRGNFSEINLLRHRETKELRALKFCCKLDGPSYTHLRAEAMLAARVSGHPFVLSPLAVSDSPGRAGNYSVLLPLCPGGDLLQLLRRQPHHALSEPDARAYAGMIAHGLLALHAAGLAYRDLKPENLLIRENGYLRIADFGFTAPLAECRKQRIGTPMYQAPELMRKQPHGVAVDWWALGCLLLEMVTGHSPFLRDDEAETEAAVLAREATSPLPLPPATANDEHAAPSRTPGESAAGAAASADGGEGAAAPSPASAEASSPPPPPPSAALASLCLQLLHPAPSERLGGVGLKASAWFEGFDWDACLAMEPPAPWSPAPLDATNADATLIELTSRCQQGFD